MSEIDERRRRRAAAQDVFDLIAADFVTRPDVTQARMFGSDGLRNDGKFFAFVGSDGGLMVKLPADMAGRLVAEGTATRVNIGRNPAREWITVPESPEQDPQRWRDLLEYAHRYATSGRTV